MKNEEMEAWIIKWALTKGVVHVRGYIHEDSKTQMFCFKNSSGYNLCAHGENKEWCRTREDAVRIVEEMRQKQIAALIKKAEKLKKKVIKIDD